MSQEVERAFIGNGLNTVILAESFAQGQAFARGILQLFQGFMALGLLVGIAALGVITSRTVVERRQQVGMLRAIGYQSNMVALSFVLEASFIAMVGRDQILPMASSQDHKARDDGDRGPNTGGMGAYSPAPIVTPQMHERIMTEVIRPTVAGLEAEGLPYTGFLYAGLMIAPDGTPKVLEYNCRFGDPETQPILMRLKSDLVELCLAALDGRLDP